MASGPIRLTRSPSVTSITPAFCTISGRVAELSALGREEEIHRTRSDIVEASTVQEQAQASTSRAVQFSPAAARPLAALSRPAICEVGARLTGIVPVARIRTYD